MVSYEYPRPALTADVVCVHDGRVLLIERGHVPFAGCWALPGGFVDAGENAAQAAARELAEETAVCVPVGALREIGAFTEPGRDPRGWVVSVAFLALVDEAAAVCARAGDDACRLAWHPLGDLPDLAFDHALIIAAASRRLPA